MKKHTGRPVHSNVRAGIEAASTKVVRAHFRDIAESPTDEALAKEGTPKTTFNYTRNDVIAFGYCASFYLLLRIVRCVFAYRRSVLNLF